MFRQRLRPRIPSLPTAISLLALSIALTGTAYAATATVVNIADKTTPANTAKVSATGALTATVTGSVSAAEVPPKSPFFLNAFTDVNSALTPQTPATTSTLALTHISFAAQTGGPAFVDLNEFDETGSTWMLGAARERRRAPARRASRLAIQRRGAAAQATSNFLRALSLEHRRTDSPRLRAHLQQRLRRATRKATRA